MIFSNPNMVSKCLTWALLAFSISIILSSPTNNKNALKNKIIAGMDIPICVTPYQAYLKYYGTPICGGAIISPTFVLSAAHCVYGKEMPPFLVGAGNRFAQNGVERRLENIWYHAGYDLETFDFDISVLKLMEPLTFGPTINKVKLPGPSYQMQALTRVFVSGYGYTDLQLPQVNPLKGETLTVMHRNECARDLRNIGMPGLSEVKFCAYADFGKSPCHGDSGGPVVNVDDDVLVGLVSYGLDCAITREAPSVYADLTSPQLRSFIKQLTDL